MSGSYFQRDTVRCGNGYQATPVFEDPHCWGIGVEYFRCLKHIAKSHGL